MTAVADNEAGDAIHVFSGFGAKLVVDVANSIAWSASGADVAAAIEGGLPEAHVNIANSDFAVVDDPPGNAVTSLRPAPTATSTASRPSSRRRSATSGSAATRPRWTEALPRPPIGPYDLEGNERAQGRCFGAAPVPDMGAYERSPTDACPPPPPPPPPPVEPRKPVFRILGLRLNKKTGFGRVLVEVPGAGTVSLTGSGVKLVRRTAPAGGGTVSLPIRTWAITRVRLAKRGRTRVHLKVLFEGRAGAFSQWGRRVLLHRRKAKPHGKRSRHHRRHG